MNQINDPFIGFQKNQIDLELGEIEEQIQENIYPLLKYKNIILEVSKSKTGLATILGFLATTIFYQIDPQKNESFLHSLNYLTIAYLYQIKQKSEEPPFSLSLKELYQKREILLEQKQKFAEMLSIKVRKL